MFEVSWQDPSTETVAQHRERKDREERKTNRKVQRSSVKSAYSNDLSANQSISRPSVLDLFTLQRNGSRGSLLSRSRSSRSSSQAIPKLPEPTLAQNRFAGGGSNSVADFIGSLSISTGERLNESICSHRRDGGENMAGSSPTTSNSDSIFSGSPRGSGTDLTWDSMTDMTSKKFEIQPLTANSFVSRCTEVTVSCQNGRDVLNCPMGQVHISADSTFTEDLDSRPTHELPTPLGLERRTPKSIRDIPILPPRAKASDLWKPPSDWDCLPGDSYQGKLPIYDETQIEDTMQATVTVIATQAYIWRIAGAGPDITLQRLREECTTVANVDMYKQAKQDGALWMLVALRAIVRYLTKGNQDLLPRQSIEPTKVLSLYESIAFTSVLASFVDAEIHHLATSTVSPNVFQSVRPIIVPLPSVILPYAPGIFSSISALSLPTVLSSSSIPALLRECHRVLIPTGTLCLTILDPSPVAATLGPRLRTWLEDHLLINLESRFRCTNPNRLLPIWMRDAGFTIPSLTGTCTMAGSTDGAQATRIYFFAVADGNWADRNFDDQPANADELNTLVGRLLWREIWGQFSDTEDWWWKDASTLAECRSYGTRWDCSIIKATKSRCG